MSDRHVRRIFVALILVFPVLMTWMAPPLSSTARAPRGAEALVPVGLVEAMLIAGLLGAYRARRGLLAMREGLACDPRQRVVDAHFGQVASPTILKSTTR